jgi:hypothetical protein
MQQRLGVGGIDVEETICCCGWAAVGAVGAFTGH